MNDWTDYAFVFVIIVTENITKITLRYSAELRVLGGILIGDYFEKTQTQLSWEQLLSVAFSESSENIEEFITNKCLHKIFSLQVKNNCTQLCSCSIQFSLKCHSQFASYNFMIRSFLCFTYVLPSDRYQRCFCLPTTSVCI